MNSPTVLPNVTGLLFLGEVARLARLRTARRYEAARNFTYWGAPKLYEQPKGATAACSCCQHVSPGIHATVRFYDPADGRDVTFLCEGCAMLCRAVAAQMHGDPYGQDIDEVCRALDPEAGAMLPAPLATGTEG